MPMLRVGMHGRSWNLLGNRANSEELMTKEITISLEEGVIETALRRARAEHTTLDDLVRGWLADYAKRQQQADEAMAVIEALREKIDTGGLKFTRDQMNER